MKEIDKVWLACALDGEGSVMIICVIGGREAGAHVQLQPTVTVNNNNLEFLDYAGMLLKCPFSYRKAYRDTYLVKVADKKAYTVLKEVLPYLIVKKEQAELVIKYYEDRQNKVKYDVDDWKTYFKIRLLNSKRKTLDEMKKELVKKYYHFETLGNPNPYERRGISHTTAIEFDIMLSRAVIELKKEGWNWI